MSLDINKLLDEVEAEVKTLLKSAQEDAATMKKAEESSKEASKEESSKEQSKEASKEASMEKALPEQSAKEGSGYESQAPEASESAAAAPADASAEASPEAASADPAAAAADPAQQQEEDAAAMLKDLDDDMLHELYQKIKMELMARMQAQEGSAPQAAPAPAADASAAAAPEQMQMSEKGDTGEKLAKAQSDLKAAQDEVAKLKKSLEEHEKGIGEFADIVKTLVERPVVRAVTDVQFVAKEGEALNKSEKKSPEEIKKAVDAIANDRKKLNTLTKAEVDTIQDFYSGRYNEEKILKVINK